MNSTRFKGFTGEKQREISKDSSLKITEKRNKRSNKTLAKATEKEDL